jgi:GABA(A) receptor-associated protein
MSSLKISFEFQKRNSQEKRFCESQRILSKYPDRIPVICEIGTDYRTQISLDKNKYLVPGDLTVGNFIYVIRKRIRLTPEKALYIFTEKGSLPPTANLLSTLYRDNKNTDGFLYLIVSLESTFG